jgi:uncharacterized membrane protein YbhN (UPF0104 family)
MSNESREPSAASQFADDPAAATFEPGTEPERALSLGERMRSPQTIASFIIAAIIIVLAFRYLNVNFGDVWTQLRQANLFYLGLAFVSYYASFPIRAMRWRLLLRNAGISAEEGYPVPGARGLSEIYVLSWFVNCVVPAKLGDAYRGYLLKKNAGPSFSRTLGTIFAERLLDIVALVGLMIVSGLFVFHGSVPGNLRWSFGAGAALAVVGIGGLIVLMTMSHRIEAFMPVRARPYYGRLSSGIVTSFSRNGFWSVAGFTSVIWFLEGARVYFAAKALGVELGVASAIFVALLASLLTTFPFTPAGLGVVEAGTVIALKLFDISAADATAVALVDRGIASYSVVLLGGLLYLVSRRK